MSLGALLRLVRWPGALTTAANAMTGFLVAHTQARTTRDEALAACGVAVAGAIVYAGGVVLNDVADSERDVALHPARPIPSGAVTRRAALRFGLALLVAGAALSMFTGGVWAGAGTAAAAVLAFVYDFAAKHSRLGGALTLGLARASNAAAGTLAAAPILEPSDALPSPLVIVYLVAVLAYTALLTFASTFEERSPSKRTAATLALALFVCAATPWATFFASWRIAPALAYLPLIATLAIASRDAAEPDGPGIGAVIRAGVFGFLLVDAAWLFGVGRYDTGFALVLGYVVLRVMLSRARS